ncbi:hypothetical protein ROZALSC1DRAFT_26288, partial [Rozella allomycis CSF55]
DELEVTQAIMGPSGGGKTRMCFEFLCVKHGVFLNCARSKDLTFILNYLHKHRGSDVENQRIAVAAARAIVFIRFRLMRIVSELGISATHWLLFQLVVFENMLDCDKKWANRVKVWIVGYLNLLNELCRSEIPNSPDANVGLFIVDEAHVLAATMEGRFVGNMGNARSFMSC